MKYEVCYIDDHILPYGNYENVGKIRQQDFERFMTENNEWSEDGVKETIKLNLINAKKYKQINFYGFVETNIFLNAQQNNGISPNTIILDFDFGTSIGTDFIPQLIKLPDLENIFFLSANAPVEDIQNEINEKRGDTQIKIEVFEKSVFHESDIKTQENIIEEYNKSFFEKSEPVVFNGHEYSFHASSIVPIPQDIWMLESILGSEFFSDKFKIHSNVISHQTIETVVNQSVVEFFVGKSKKRIYSANGLSYAKYFNEYDDLEKMKPIYAIKNFDLAVLEEAYEKCYSIISNDEERM